MEHNNSRLSNSGEQSILHEKPGKNATDLEFGNQSEKVEPDNFFIEDSFRLLDRGKTHYIKLENLKKALIDSKIMKEEDIQISPSKKLYNKEDYIKWVSDQTAFDDKKFHDYLYKKNLGCFRCCMCCSCCLNS